MVLNGWDICDINKITLEAVDANGDIRIIEWPISAAALTAKASPDCLPNITIDFIPTSIVGNCEYRTGHFIGNITKETEKEVSFIDEIEW